jgi:hypothetical protein
MEENAHRSQPSQARSGGDVVDIAIYAALPDCGLWRACRLRESVHPPMTPAEASMAGGNRQRDQERQVLLPIDRRLLPAAPLVEVVHGYAMRRQQPLDVLMRPWLLQALKRGERHGQVTVLTGERICDEVLGWHPRMVWGDLYDATVRDLTPHQGPAPVGSTAYRRGCRCLECREANTEPGRTTHRPTSEGGERSA